MQYKSSSSTSPLPRARSANTWVCKEVSDEIGRGSVDHTFPFWPGEALWEALRCGHWNQGRCWGSVEGGMNLSQGAWSSPSFPAPALCPGVKRPALSCLRMCWETCLYISTRRHRYGQHVYMTTCVNDNTSYNVRGH